MVYQPKTGEKCTCKRGRQRDNCPECEGTGWRINFAAIRMRAPGAIERGEAAAIVETPMPKARLWRVTVSLLVPHTAELEVEAVDEAEAMRKAIEQAPDADMEAQWGSQAGDYEVTACEPARPSTPAPSAQAQLWRVTGEEYEIALERARDSATSEDHSAAYWQLCRFFCGRTFLRDQAELALNLIRGDA